MEAFGILKFWRSTTAVDQLRSAAFGTDEESTDGEDSFFDLVLKSSQSAAIKGSDEASDKDFQFIESPRDVFLMSKIDSSITKPLSPLALLRSSPKFRIFKLGHKKSSKCEESGPIVELKASPLNNFSILTRDNSLRSKLLSESSDDIVSSEKKIPKYLKLMKPFYMKVSKKAKLTESVAPLSSPVTAPVNFSPRNISEGSKVGSLKIVVRNLGKSRSASSSVAVAGLAPSSTRRRDDSLLEQHDGIQGAILHCKKSYNSSSKEFSQLFRSQSDPPLIGGRAHGRNSTEEQKRCSI